MDLVSLLLLFSLASEKEHLPPHVLESVCYIESHYNVKAFHKDDGGTDSIGVCQVKLETAQWLGFRGSKKQLMKPKTNIKYASKYLGYQLKRYSGDVNKAIISYNRGNAKNLTSTKYSDKVNKVLEERK